jgi:hypothetical protein
MAAKIENMIVKTQFHSVTARAITHRQNIVGFGLLRHGPAIGKIWRGSSSGAKPNDMNASDLPMPPTL